MTLMNRLAQRRGEAGPDDENPAKPGLKLVEPPLDGQSRTQAPAPALATAKPATAESSSLEAKNAIHALFVDRHADDINIGDREGVRTKLAAVADDYFRDRAQGLNRFEFGNLIDSLLDDVIGLGPLQSLLEDHGISEVMINHPKQVFVERAGRLVLSPVTFESAAQLRQVIDRIVSTIGRRVESAATQPVSGATGSWMCTTS